MTAFHLVWNLLKLFIFNFYPNLLYFVNGVSKNKFSYDLEILPFTIYFLKEKLLSETSFKKKDKFEQRLNIEYLKKYKTRSIKVIWWLTLN